MSVMNDLYHSYIFKKFVHEFGGMSIAPPIIPPKPQAPMVPIMRAVQLPPSSAIDMRETLIEARGLVDRGWTRGVQHDVLGDGSQVYCMLGAVAAAANNLFGRVHDLNWRERLINDTIDVLYRQIPRPEIHFMHDLQGKAYFVMDYNDRSDSKDRVLALFDRAIASVPVPYVPESARALVQA